MELIKNSLPYILAISAFIYIMSLHDYGYFTPQFDIAVDLVIAYILSLGVFTVTGPFRDLKRENERLRKLIQDRESIPQQHPHHVS